VGRSCNARERHRRRNCRANCPRHAPTTHTRHALARAHNNTQQQQQQHPITRHCPPLDIMLRGAERGVGMCTDVALYVMHAGGRVIPMPADVAAYDAACGPRTARLFLETLYQEFLSAQRGVLHMQLVNAEHFWSADAAVHARMNVFLWCVRVCQQGCVCVCVCVGCVVGCVWRGGCCMWSVVAPHALRHWRCGVLPRAAAIPPPPAPPQSPPTARCAAHICTPAHPRSKTYMCVDLLHRHVADKGGWAQVWYMSHTSSDASVGVSGDVLAGAL
jgi:hypothetical protein